MTTMKSRMIYPLVVAVAASVVGCGEPKKVAVMQVSSDGAVGREHGQDGPPEQRGRPEREESPEHGDHDRRHAFANPAELAKAWNDPERDDWQFPEEIVAAMAVGPGGTVADIGAGTGYMAAHLSRAVGEGGTVIAIDVSAAMIGYLTERSDDLGPARVLPRQVRPDDPELSPAGVDGVVTLDTWHHVGGRESYARKVYEGLRRGGRLVVVDYEPDADVGPPVAMRLGPGQVMEQLESAGFRVEVVPESMPRHYMVVGHKD